MPHVPSTPHTHDTTTVVFRRNPGSEHKNNNPHAKRVVQHRHPQELRNGAVRGAGQKNVKLDSETSSKKTRVVSKTFRTALTKARLAKKWKQEELARHANLKPQDINDFEQGKRAPDGARLGKLRRALGVELPAVYA